MILKILIVLFAVVIAGFVFLIVKAKFAELSRGMKAVNRVNSTIEKIGTEPEAARLEIKKLAIDPEHRNTLYECLKSAGKADFFPEEYLNQEAFAESDLVFWLCHPNELQKAPDKIELASKVRKKLPGASEESEFFIFRFRVCEPHWAAKNGWMVGITGPYSAGDEIQARASGTFSELESFASRTPEEHVDNLLPKLSSIMVTGTRG